MSRLSMDDVLFIQNSVHKGIEHCSVTIKAKAFPLKEVSKILGREIQAAYPIFYIVNPSGVVMAYQGVANDVWIFSDGFS